MVKFILETLCGRRPERPGFTFSSLDAQQLTRALVLRLMVLLPVPERPVDPLDTVRVLWHPSRSHTETFADVPSESELGHAGRGWCAHCIWEGTATKTRRLAGQHASLLHTVDSC